jgi:predicted enzyme related to lactoylglutathione lyase
MFTHIGTISLHVSDQDRALDFYVDTLGFEVRSDTPMSAEERWLTVAPPGAQTEMMLSTVSSAGQPHGFLGYILYADDIDATCATLAERGVTFTDPLHDEPWGRWAQFADPDGNEFGIWAPPRMG